MNLQDILGIIKEMPTDDNLQILIKWAESADKELDQLHECLTSLYECKYNNENERVRLIKETISKIQ